MRISPNQNGPESARKTSDPRAHCITQAGKGETEFFAGTLRTVPYNEVTKSVTHFIKNIQYN
jgi:hypothetical protein